MYSRFYEAIISIILHTYVWGFWFHSVFQKMDNGHLSRGNFIFNFNFLMENPLNKKYLSWNWVTRLPMEILIL